MTSTAFIEVAEVMQARWWAFPIPASALDQYAADLGDLPVAAVLTALHALAADGLERPPASGQIRRRVAELELDAPSWDEARTALVCWRHNRDGRHRAIAAWACPEGACDGSGLVEVEEWEPGSAATMADCKCRPARTAALRGLGELPVLLAEFVAGEHVEASELEKFLEHGDRTAEAQVRDRFRSFCERAVTSRVLAGLPNPAGLPRLDAARDEDAPRRDPKRGVLQRFNPAALIGRAA